MKTFVIAVATFVAYAAAVPASMSAHIDVYRNIIEAPTARIVRGEDAKRRQFPYQATVLWNWLGTFDHVCGGTLISEKWVLTAGHCKTYDFGEYQVILGQLKQNEIHEDVQIFKVVQIIVHSGYPGRGAVAANDLALIELDRPAKLTDGVQIAKLAEEGDCNAIEDSLLSGWGRTNDWTETLPANLQWVQLPRITNKQCAEDIASILGHPEPLDETMLCTGSNLGPQQTACNGDSGGPLVLKSSNTLIGVISWGIFPCGTNRAPTVFTRVCSHYDFINQYVKK